MQKVNNRKEGNISHEQSYEMSPDHSNLKAQLLIAHFKSRLVLITDYIVSSFLLPKNKCIMAELFGTLSIHIFSLDAEQKQNVFGPSCYRG